MPVNWQAERADKLKALEETKGKCKSFMRLGNETVCSKGFPWASTRNATQCRHCGVGIPMEFYHGNDSAFA